MLAAKARLLLCWSDNKVKIWRIDEIDESLLTEEAQIGKRYLLEMEFNVIVLEEAC